MSLNVKRNYLRIICLLSMTFLFLTIFSTNVFAQDNPSAQAMGVLDLSKLDLSQDITTTEDGYILEKVSYEKMIQDIAAKRGITIEEAMLENPDQTSTSSINAIQPTQAPYYYLHIRRDLPVNGWIPQLDIYVYMYSSGSFNEFKEIKDINLIRSHNYQSKQFSGKAQAILFSGIHLYWVVNGDFYNNGTTKASFTGTVGIGKYASTSFTISGSTSHFGYIYRTGDITF